MGSATLALAEAAYDGRGNRAALAAATKRILRSMSHLLLVEDITRFETLSFKHTPFLAIRHQPRRAFSSAQRGLVRVKFEHQPAAEKIAWLGPRLTPENP
jgi:hypothetical protein